MIDDGKFLFLMIDQTYDRALRPLDGLSDDRGVDLGGEAPTNIGPPLCRSLLCPSNLCLFGFRPCLQAPIGLSYPAFHFR